MTAAGIALGGGAAVALATAAQAAPSRTASEPFGYCFNTSTIRGQGLPLSEVVEIAAKAGYDAVEPWINEIDKYVADGGSLSDLTRRIKDLGLTVESAIGFAEWIVDDEARRAKGLEEARRNMALVAELGGTRIAAPPAGAVDVSGLDLFRAAERFHALIELGLDLNIVPQVELWGFSRTLSRLGETALVAVESRHPQSCMLLDVYHLHKGGSGFAGLRLVNGAAMHVFHVNDYPAEPPRETINDADRVYPGDGVAPLADIFRDLAATGFRGHLSLELFNRGYWEQDAYQVAKTGLEKTREAVQKSFS